MIDDFTMNRLPLISDAEPPRSDPLLASIATGTAQSRVPCALQDRGGTAALVPQGRRRLTRRAPEPYGGIGGPAEGPELFDPRLSVCVCVCARARACLRACLRACVRACVRVRARACACVRVPSCFDLRLFWAGLRCLWGGSESTGGSRPRGRVDTRERGDGGGGQTDTRRILSQRNL